MIFRIQGDEVSFLTLIDHLYRHALMPEAIHTFKEKGEKIEGSLWGEQEIIGEEEVARKVWKAILARFDSKSISLLRDAFLAPSPPFLEMLSFVILGFKEPKFLQNPNIPCVRNLERLHRAIHREIHRYIGFLRFKEKEAGWLYAAFAPQYLILEPLGDHFAQRMGQESFILHDEARGSAFFYSQGRRTIKTGVSVTKEENEEKKGTWEERWRLFLESATIPERRNENLQRSLLPLSYRRFMTEFEP